MGLQAVARQDAPTKRRKYCPPLSISSTTLGALLRDIGRPGLDAKQMSFLNNDSGAMDAEIYYAGHLDILRRPAVAIVGAREVSEIGAKKARVLAKAIGDGGVTVVSGLAKGVDRNAHLAAMVSGHPTVAVIGTPLTQAYPAENSEIQEEIAADHLLISPFPDGSRVFQSNFPKRNRVMAALTDGTVIIEATDSSGTLHQAAECQRLGRWLFIVRSVFEDPALTWPRSFASYARTRVVSSPKDVLDHVLGTAAR